MNKVTTVNLNGNAFQLEETGYDALRSYLDCAAAKLASNPDRDEIISDIEQAIADKLRAMLGAYKTVVTAKQIEAVIAEMGPVEGAEGATEASASAGATGAGATTPEGAGGSTAASGGAGVRRLYRLYDGAIISGVCNGLAAYFRIDPTVVRLVFIILTILTSGAFALAYVVMIFAVPAADTPAQKTAAHGATSTTQEFIRRAKEGYYEGLRSIPDKEARREWKRKFKRDMQNWAHGFQWEMHAGAERWRQRCGAACPPLGPGWVLMIPVLCLAHAGLALGCLVALVSLLTSGAVLGIALPAGIPVWAGVIILLVSYSIVVLPLKMARHVYRHQYGYAAHPAGAIVHLWEALVWLAFVGVLLWLAYRHMALVMDAIHSVPPLFHDAVDAIRRWWSK